MEKVSVIGMGYVGFPLACAIAKCGKYETLGFDIDEKKIDMIKARKAPVDDRRASDDILTVSLRASSSSDDLKDSDYIIIAVPTPVTEAKNPDLGPVKSAVELIVPYMKKGQIIILESTVNPGVCDEDVLPILERSGLKAGVDFDLAHCPERINPGDEKFTVYNINRNIGASSLSGVKRAAAFYRSFLDEGVLVNEMSSLQAAEATKIVENTFRDINIAYVNELAKSFEMMGLDIVEVINGAANKPFAFLAHYPGCGVGGHCIPVDPYYLIEKAKKIGFTHDFLIYARKVNNSMPGYTVGKLSSGLNELKLSVNGTKVGLLGLSYKANVADFRESPAFQIKKKLEKLGADLLICEPHADGYEDLDRILEECVAVVIAADHNEFKQIRDWGNVRLVVDGRNCLDKEEIKAKGILYKGIGRN
ncbi:nucleotide sugar dehydrogenase [Candidatus Woesearchaeota archaeon]|nr:nucleotide sugar dehydrogenase [Nanoarchaeota archaeon]MCB9371014.1 nucleotide sugar dehydrogenase [Candidatus Woesearchaeota archaeon]USN44125.1 MAG: nucleotide sugar dehydrogenase [Candidatus Woesearchaeota archaeon]